MQHYWTTASVFCVLAILFPFVSTAQTSPFRRADIQARQTDLLLNTVTAIHVFHVLDGESLRTVIPKGRLHSDSFTVDGYISGLVVFCENEMTVQAEGRRFSRLNKNPDGSFSAKYYGRLDPGAVSARIGDYTYFETPNAGWSKKPDEEILQSGYSLFPKVTGDALSPRQILQLALETEDDRREITIHQKGFEKSALKMRNPDAGHRAVYIGTRLARLRNEIPDFEARWAAIQKGISGVEKQLGRHLISRVVLLDYAAIHNAISCENSDDIWFYIETFREEPVPELETIAAHEAIHKYVDQRQLTRSDALRKWFSDLKGYDLFSMERFLLLTQGMLPADAEASEAENSLFFAFIDERNFLEDRKGGHSRDNLDEFCTSFIHSVLHIHRLKGNLNRRILLHDDIRRELTDSEKKALLKTFRESLAIFNDMLRLREDADSAPDRSVFTAGMATAAQVHIHSHRRVTTAAIAEHSE
ncbi:MAG: hypothetical protein ACOC0H_03530 [Thermodesulfobacteriota bacterium]